ncbi:hypothetical protein RhiirA1_538436 [Rhizophagus irregularis]|uniref:Uncharacterized protein n=1 Tax=Rhizophagus irregularis TaxID=588596 RepID=A0A2N0RGW9_9GLOM|nr:hypothetical protein RhiirA1_538436 [Rhizophagus irregularis]
MLRVKVVRASSIQAKFFYPNMTTGCFVLSFYMFLPLDNRKLLDKNYDQTFGLCYQTNNTNRTLEFRFLDEKLRTGLWNYVSCWTNNMNRTLEFRFLNENYEPDFGI